MFSIGARKCLPVPKYIASGATLQNPLTVLMVMYRREAFLGQ